MPADSSRVRLAKPFDGMTFLVYGVGRGKPTNAQEDSFRRSEDFRYVKTEYT